MTSTPLNSTYGQTTSGVTCYHRLWTAHTVIKMSCVALHHRPWIARTVGRHRAWHNITAFGQHTRSNDVGRGMPSSPFGSTNGQTTSGVACHHSPWTANTVGRRQALHAITAFGQHTRSNDVGCGMTSPLLDNTHGRTTLGVACHHRLWVAHTVKRRRAWHDVIAFGQHARSYDIGRSITSLPLESTHD